MSNDIKFDPQTGEPIAQTTPTPAQPEQAAAEPAPTPAETEQPAAFDPQTGEPVAQTAQAPAEQTQAPTEQAQAPKKGKAGKLIAGVVAAAAVVTGGVFGIKSMTGGGSPVEQFRTAVDNTFVSDEMTDQFKAAGDIAEDGTYAIDAAINVEGQDVNLRLDTADGKLSLDADAKIQGMDLAASLFMDDQKITVDLSKLADVDPLSYDYTTDKSGASDSYVVKMIGEDTLKQVDSILQMTKSMTAAPDRDKIEDAVYDKLGELDYEELDEKEFTVGGDKVSCTGYETTMTGEFLYELMNDVYKEAYGKTLDEMMKEMGSLGVDTSQTDDLESQMKEMDEIDMQFYLNDEKFAMLGFETKADDKDVDVEITFEDKDIPWHQMTIKNVEDDQEIKLNVEDTDDKLVYTLEGNGSGGSLEYAKEDGAFEVKADDETVAKGMIKADGDKLTVKIDEVSGQSVAATVDITDDVEVKDAPENTKDVLEMSESDFSEIANKIISKFYGL